jgi:hypothetical protein
MLKPVFGAKIEVGSLSSFTDRQPEKIRSQANTLDQRYADIPDSVLKISINEAKVYDEFSQKIKPTVQAKIFVQNADQLGERITSLSKRVFDLLPGERYGHFFKRVERETNKLLAAAGQASKIPPSENALAKISQKALILGKKAFEILVL